MLSFKSLQLRSMPTLFMMAPVSNFNFSSRYAMHRIIADRQKITLPKPEEVNLVMPMKKSLRKEGKTPKKVWIDVHTTKRRALYTKQLTPVHDYINFKKMTGNEILLNLQNVEHLTISEILGALNQVVQIPEEERLEKNINWMEKPVIQDAVWKLKAHLPYMTARQLQQMPQLIEKLHWLDSEIWFGCEHNILRLLHKFKANDIANFLDLFDRDFTDSNGRELKGFRKAHAEFFERLTAILPMYLPSFNNKQLLRSFEVLVKRRMGSERLFNAYIYTQIERNILSFDGKEYTRLLRTLAEKGYQDDKVFWNDFVFDYLRLNENGKPKGKYKQDDVPSIRSALKKVQSKLITLDTTEA